MHAKVLITTALFFFGILSVFAQREMPITEVSRDDLNKGILVDVRTPAEFEAGHLEGALNIDWLGDDFMSEVAQLQENKPIYLYCQKGGRSARAAHLLDSLGYSVIDLRGGYQAFLRK